MAVMYDHAGVFREWVESMGRLDAMVAAGKVMKKSGKLKATSLGAPHASTPKASMHSQTGKHARALRGFEEHCCLPFTSIRQEGGARSGAVKMM
jgi:hypothetical protein